MSRIKLSRVALAFFVPLLPVVIAGLIEGITLGIGCGIATGFAWGTLLGALEVARREDDWRDHR